MSGEKSAQNRYAYPKFKVFVFGVEVTADVTAITTNSHDGNAPNTCQITMLNELDKYVFTSADIIALNGVKAPRLNIPWLDKSDTISKAPSGQAASGTTQGSDAFNNAVKQSIFQKTKQDVLTAKYNIKQTYPASSRTDVQGRQMANTDFANYFGETIKKYPLLDGAPIFHSMDPVRVFMRDPFDPKRWYHHFVGFVSDMVDNTDENNTKTLTIVVEDPTKLLRYTRLFVNPGILDANSVIASNDMKVQSFMASFMNDFNLAEIFFTIMFGPDRVGATKLQQSVDSQKGTSSISTALRGIGHFAFDTSGVFLIGPDAPQASPAANSKPSAPQTDLLNVKPSIKIDGLTTWQSILDHEVFLSDLYTMATDDDRNTNESDIRTRMQNVIILPDGSADIEGVCAAIGSRPDQYLVDGGRLLMLIPNSLGADNRDILVKDIIQTYPLNSEWHSVGSILMEALDRIQFVMYCTPKGDVVVEPPLYDFDPDDFGLNPISESDFVSHLPTTIDSVFDSGKAIISIQTGESFANQFQTKSYDRGPFGTKYVVLKKDTCGWESAIVDEKVHTMAVTSKSIFKGYETLPNTDIIGDLIVANIPDLVPLYGTRAIQIVPRGYITSAEGAHLFAQIALNKLNADAHTVNINHIPNIQLWLNRPIYIEGRNIIGTTKQITQTLTWGQKGEMSTTQDLYAVRTWNGDMDSADPTRPIWTPIGGYGAHNTLNYAILFKTAPEPSRGASYDQGDYTDRLDNSPLLGPASDAINAARNFVELK